jgi:hypothetical protein
MSRKDIYTPFFVISAEVSGRDDYTNDDETRNLRFILEKELKLPFKEAEGYYDGDTEQSFIVFTNNPKPIMELARALEQESVLYVGPKRESVLYYTDGREDTEQYVGRWEEVSLEVLEATDEPYTLSEGVYYRTRRIS